MSIAIRAYQLDKTATPISLQRVMLAVAKPGPQEVLVQVAAASLNYRDVLTLRGQNGEFADQLVPLSDAAGIVCAVGSAVSRWRVGDRVMSSFFPNWQSGSFKQEYLSAALGGGQTPGVLAEQVLFDQHAVVAVPAHLSLAQAATLPCAGLTAWNGLFTRGALRRGETVLIQGTGGVALFALQLAVAQGARAIVISSSDAKLQRAKTLGAWQTINYRSHANWHELARELTGGRGVDHVVELGGLETFERSIAALAAGGRIAQIGVLSGFGANPNLQSVLFLNASVNGICVGSAEQLEALCAFISEHQISPIIDREFDFTETPEAFAYLAGAEHFGKVVIRLDQA
jgi:NADPH:quinone reductase-like Zn-dependent oxidoreductase